MEKTRFGIKYREIYNNVYSDDFEAFKSNVCHCLKSRGDINFIRDVVLSDVIIEFCDKEQYLEALYMVAMLDYISKENDIPLCDRYDHIRKWKMENIMWPRSVVACAAYSKHPDAVYQRAWDNAIAEFLKYNIVEGEIRNVC